MSRDYCVDCSRPLTECYCDAITVVNNNIPLTILQHPAETNHPYNTARIVQRCLANCELLVGEQFDNRAEISANAQSMALIFPDLAWLPNTEPLPMLPDKLIVIDATWKKAKKIMHLNPWLQSLPRVSLSNIPSSQYAIRKTSMKDGLATLESVYYGFSKIDPTTDYSSLLQPFEKMIHLARRYLPESSN